MSVVAGLDWQKLATYAATPFPPGWPEDTWVLFSPRDPHVHQAELDVIGSCNHSLLANHFGYTDPQVAELVKEKFADPDIAGVLNLDSRQEASKTEHALVEADYSQWIGTTVAIGESIRHDISHLKVTVIDGLYTLSGSTNLSLQGEEKEDNELVIRCNALVAARYSAVIMLNHAAMLQATLSKP